MAMKQQLVEQIWAGKDPFATFPAKAYPVDIQGWNSHHRFLIESIEELRPSLVVEIGVWKGGSVITMGNTLKDLGLDSAVIAVDTWLGAWDHWLNPGFFEDLGFESGYPKLFHRFMANIIHVGLTDYVVPLPLDSGNAVEVLKAKSLRPGLIHLDGAHDYESVSRDLKVWWAQLAPGGILVADDYTLDGRWPEVRAAVDEFFAPLGLTVEHHEAKGRIRKPA
jgi:predicted O-methyltransferase YrrM